MTDKRDWLNPKEHDDTGAISSHCEVEESYDGESTYFESSLTIRDCSRQICLEFGCDSIEHIQDRVKKLNIIRSHLDFIESEMRDYFENKWPNS